MQATEASPATPSDAVDAARVAIWRLFQEGYVDEDMATASLLAVDLGTRRAQRKDTKRAVVTDRLSATTAPRMRER
ncbi:MAG: hypothetical protein JO352_34435 [Chloroflexi bacterium]|nr:hypothetical protein [Chloroflexota bacterium]MBV9599421.1 hypothetical protein [Chloroflexota bacterium]